jgi:hypothetical protein
MIELGRPDRLAAQIMVASVTRTEAPRQLSTSAVPGSPQQLDKCWISLVARSWVLTWPGFPPGPVTEKIAAWTPLR